MYFIIAFHFIILLLFYALNYDSTHFQNLPVVYRKSVVALLLRNETPYKSLKVGEACMNVVAENGKVAPPKYMRDCVEIHRNEDL